MGFQALPGRSRGSRGVQGPPGGSRGLQGVTRAPGEAEISCGMAGLGHRGLLKRDLNALRLDGPF